MRTTEPVSFYDALAPYYHLLYGDWEVFVGRQGAALHELLRECGIDAGAPVHDAACGIGTQTLGLAQNGYRMSASDISPVAVERMKAELSRRGLRADATVDDMRVLEHVASASMAAVIACDNSIPHLLSDAEIVRAFASFRRCLRPGGVAVISVRDYATIERRNLEVRPYDARRDNGTRRFAVQVWEWDGDCYDLRLYLTSESPEGECETRVLVSRYYAITIARLLELMAEAGFADVQRRDDVLFQPVLLGRRSHAA